MLSVVSFPDEKSFFYYFFNLRVDSRIFHQSVDTPKAFQYGKVVRRNFLLLRNIDSITQSIYAMSVVKNICNLKQYPDANPTKQGSHQQLRPHPHADARADLLLR